MTGTLLITLGKIFISCFPFLRELFLGDPRGTKNGRRKNDNAFLKRVIIAVGLFCALFSVYLTYQLWVVSLNYHKLSKEHEAVKTANRPPTLPATKASEPDPVPLIDKDPPGSGIATTPGANKQRRVHVHTGPVVDYQLQRLKDIQD